MARVLIRDLDERVVDRLKKRAIGPDSALTSSAEPPDHCRAFSSSSIASSRRPSTVSAAAVQTPFERIDCQPVIQQRHARRRVGRSGSERRPDRHAAAPNRDRAGGQRDTAVPPRRTGRRARGIRRTSGEGRVVRTLLVLTARHTVADLGVLRIRRAPTLPAVLAVTEAVSFHALTEVCVGKRWNLQHRRQSQRLMHFPALEGRIDQLHDSSRPASGRRHASPGSL